MSFIDLSLSIYDGSPAYPGDPDCKIKPFFSIPEHGCNVSEISFSSHNGTHLDAPKHFLGSSDALAVNQLPIERFCGRGRMIDCTMIPKNEPITADFLEKNFDEIFTPRAIVLIATGWDKMYGKKEYYTDFPYISCSAAEWIAKKKISFLGLDLPTPNRYDSKSVHETLLRADIVLCEGLANLMSLPRERQFDFYAFPLKLIGLDGSPVRAVARI